MIKPFGLINEMKIIKILLLLIFLWAISMTVLVLILMAGQKRDLELWKKQLDFDKSTNGFIKRQVEFNKNVQKYVIVNL